MKKSIQVKGMHCAACESLIKDVLEELPGVQVGFTSFKGCVVEFDFDPEKTPIELIKKTIKAEGYSF